MNIFRKEVIEIFENMTEDEARKEILKYVEKYAKKYHNLPEQFYEGNRIAYASRVYDEKEGFAFALGENLSAFDDMAGYSSEIIRATNALKQYEIVSGTDGKNFNPDKAITRAEFVKMLSNAELFDGNIPETVHEFSDVAKTDWSYPYIQNAYEKGWIKGATDTEFKPSDVITEEEIILILNRIKENAFEPGEDKPCNRADAAVLIYEFINRV